MFVGGNLWNYGSDSINFTAKKLHFSNRIGLHCSEARVGTQLIIYLCKYWINSMLCEYERSVFVMTHDDF